MDKNELKKIENFYKIIEILRRKLLDRNDISKNSDKINYILRELGIIVLERETANCP